MDTILLLPHTLIRAFLDWYAAGGPGPYCLWSTGGIVFFCTLAAIFYRPACQFLQFFKIGSDDSFPQLRR